MVDIIFHIGLSKCASSTLQNIVFQKTDGYLGIGKHIPNQFNLARKFPAFSRIGLHLNNYTYKAQKWSEEVLKLKEKKFPNVKRLILSNESLSSISLLEQRPIISNLKNFKEQVWKDKGEVKIILVLRNQPEKIASTYSQMTKIYPKASQFHFEGYVNKILEKYKYTLEYDKWVKDLYDNFGSKNVCVLFMEDIQSISFWSELKVFAELPEFDPMSMINSNARSNKRSIDPNTWEIRDYSPTHHKKRIKKRLLNIPLPDIILSTNILNQKYFKYLSNREDKIYLSEELRFKILKAYSLSNKRLGKLLERDLTNIGYDI